MSYIYLIADQQITTKIIAEFIELRLTEGFAEMSTTITFFLYEMAQNQEIQTYLYRYLEKLPKNMDADLYCAEILKLEFLDICLLGKYLFKQ